METRFVAPAKPLAPNAGTPRSGLTWLPVSALVLVFVAVGADVVRLRGARSVEKPSSSVASSEVMPAAVPPSRPPPLRSGPKAMLARPSSAPRQAPTRIRRTQLTSRAEFERLDPNGLQDAWSKEENDPEWSSNVRAFMDVFLQTAAVDPSALRAADCRASLCRLEVDFSAPDSLGRVGRTMTDSGRHLRSTWLPQLDGGPRVAVVYIPREDLPAQ